MPNANRAVAAKVVHQKCKSVCNMVPIGIMGSKCVWRCLIEVHGVEQEGRRNYENTTFCCFLLPAEAH